MPPKGNGWRESYVKKILQNPAVIGEYQPYHRVDGKREKEGDPIPHYFPQIIESVTFEAVQEVFRQNQGTGGRTGKANNLFRNLAKCPYCGAQYFLSESSD